MRNFNGSKIGFIRKIFCIFLIAVIGTFVCNKVTDPQCYNAYFGAYRDKIEKLKNTDGERTIFVGGSSVLMGVNAEYYKTISQKNAINMGVVALKIYDVYLACIEPYIKEGDTVVLALEYCSYNYEWKEYDNNGLIIAHESGEYYKVVKPKYRGIYTYSQFLRSYTKLYADVYSRLVEKRIKGEEKAYLRKNINEYGDMNPEINKNNENPEAYRYDLTIKEDAVKNIMEYINSYEKKGAKVYITFPPIYTDKDISENYGALMEFREKLCSYFGDRVLGNPTDWMFNEDSKFWDTGYHLTSGAAIDHTEYYYELIKEAESNKEWK